MATTTTPDIPEKSWTNPFTPETFLHDIFDKVVRENRDIVIVVSDLRGRRGTGKTVTSLQLASQMDQTDEGVTMDKCTLSAEELRNAYATLPKRSALVFDEAEVGAGNRDAMTKTNKALREVMSMARVEEKYLVVNVPIKGFIDKDILKLADVWIAMERRGRGLVHHLKWEPYSETLHTEKKQRLELPDIEKGTELRRVYNELTREKRRHISGEDGQTFIPKPDHDEKVEAAEEQARREKRNEVLRAILRDEQIREEGVSQKRVGDAVGLHQTTINKIVNQQE